MLVIKIDDEVLTFDSKTGGWVSSDEVLATVLNGMLPDDLGSPQTTFSEGGNEGTILRHLQTIWTDLKVVAFEPEPPPDDEPGVIY